MKTILGLDLALHTGFSITRGNKIIRSGVWDFSMSRDNGHNGHLFSDLDKQLMGTYMEEGPVELIRIERAHHRGGPATRIALGLMAIVMCFCADYGIEFEDVHTATLKKYFTGNGKASKADMMARASEIAGRTVRDNDEADAILISFYKNARYAYEDNH